ncbi:MAG TPA: UDP-N-acetylmuramoyl-L-alanyl-D-glutamate--2,6-diaminopimelate ligase [Rhodothermales bacterium]|nr:UDP-N-acetylmuramoyl-L-alanyl-D-glutamate--2,6-diaminopimelate ligase [Rhodothermales bacterium]
MMQLHALLARLEREGLVRAMQGSFDDRTIERLAHDSRAVGPNTLFVAIRGERVDGHLFIDKAVKNGAIAVVCETVPEGIDLSGTALAQVTDARAALAELAAANYGDPSQELRMVGVTGTNGKTTITFLVHRVLTSLLGKTGLIGTIATLVDGARVEASMTTPDTLDINRLLRQMVDAGCKACAMEVSSHALHQQRVRGIDYDVAIFSNLTQDHLDYHKTLDNYLAAKKLLFDGLSANATALYNIDDPSGPKMVQDTRAKVVSYGRSLGADIRLDVLDNGLNGLRLRIDGIERTFRLVGLFNAYNLTAAYGAARALGLGSEQVLDVLAEASPVPGRFEQLTFAGGTTVIVDYAHTPDALENVLQTIRDTKPQQAALWCLFGCGGDRDVTKRPIMARVAERYADHMIVTSDNPRTEQPGAIMEDIRQGLERPAGATWIVDRREAIGWAAEHLRQGDVLLVAGKGHETYQIVGTEKRHFDDHEEVERAFGARA